MKNMNKGYKKKKMISIKNMIENKDIKWISFIPKDQRVLIKK